MTSAFTMTPFLSMCYQCKSIYVSIPGIPYSRLDPDDYPFELRTFVRIADEETKYVTVSDECIWCVR